MTTYGFLPITVICLLAYLVSYYLTKTKFLKFTKHRRIWNLVLLVVFLITGLMGMTMSFLISFEFDIEIPYGFFQIHVICGNVWFIVALFHFLWHRTYFKKALKVIFTKAVK